MADNQKTWDKIDAILDEIERLQTEIGVPVHSPFDGEAFGIVSHIEREILVRGEFRPIGEAAAKVVAGLRKNQHD